MSESRKYNRLSGFHPERPLYRTHEKFPEIDWIYRGIIVNPHQPCRPERSDWVKSPISIGVRRRMIEAA